MSDFNKIINRIRSGEITSENAAQFVSPLDNHAWIANALISFCFQSVTGVEAVDKQVVAAAMALAIAHTEKLNNLYNS
jgi:hypothetical protein